MVAVATVCDHMPPAPPFSIVSLVVGIVRAQPFLSAQIAAFATRRLRVLLVIMSSRPCRTRFEPTRPAGSSDWFGVY